MPRGLPTSAPTPALVQTSQLTLKKRRRLGSSSISVITQTLIMAKIKVNFEVALRAVDAGLVMHGKHVIPVSDSREVLDA